MSIIGQLTICILGELVVNPPNRSRYRLEETAVQINVAVALDGAFLVDDHHELAAVVKDLTVCLAVFLRDDFHKSFLITSNSYMITQRWVLSMLITCPAFIWSGCQEREWLC